VDKLNLLGVALGLACLAGVNLYLTVFVTGLAIHQHWIVLSSSYQSLEVLGNPWIVAISGVLFFLEFFADKVPWIDSAWDAVHTVIRPIGGALLAVQTLGHPSPGFDVVVGLLAGGTSLLTHTAKSASRLAANTSPEPFSNIGLSVAEDVAVLGGLALIHFNPVLALAIFAVALAAFIYFVPKVLRAIRTRVWLILKKLNGPAHLDVPASPPIALPSKFATVFADQNLLGETIAWAVPCVSGKGRRIPPNIFGALVATNEEPRKLVFVGRKRGRAFSQTIELEGSMVARDPKFLSENLVIFPAAGKGPKYLFIFERPRGAIVEQITEYLRARLTPPAANEIEPEPLAHF
jgi:hypothetical protein